MDEESGLFDNLDLDSSKGAKRLELLLTMSVKDVNIYAYPLFF